MKKALALFAVLLCFVASGFSQDEVYTVPEDKSLDTTIETIIPEDIHSDIRTAKVRIEYTRMADEVRIYYTCLDVQFDQGEAMNTILACLKDFEAENQYLRYTFLAKDRTRYYTDTQTKMKMAQYSSYVKFERR